MGFLDPIKSLLFTCVSWNLKNCNNFVKSINYKDFKECVRVYKDWKSVGLEEKFEGCERDCTVWMCNFMVFTGSIIFWILLIAFSKANILNFLKHFHLLWTFLQRPYFLDTLYLNPVWWDHSEADQQNLWPEYLIRHWTSPIDHFLSRKTTDHRLQNTSSIISLDIYFPISAFYSCAMGGNAIFSTHLKCLKVSHHGHFEVK